MPYEVAFDDDCYAWFSELDEKVQDKIMARIRLLEEGGPQLGRPHVDAVKGSVFRNMKELIIQIGGDPWRILLAFDPRRSAILLLSPALPTGPSWEGEAPSEPPPPARLGRSLALPVPFPMLDSIVGGNKGGDDRWHKTHVPIADERFARHLASLGRASDRKGGSPTKPRRNPGTS